MRTVLPMALLLVTATVAHADHKLLITDVLSAGDVEVSATFGYSHTEYDFTTNIWFSVNDPHGITESKYLTGRFTDDSVGSAYSFGIGLGGGLQLNVGVPYYFIDEATYRYDWYFWPTHRDRRDGFGDFMLGLKYLLYEDASQSVAMVTGLEVKPRTAPTDRHGTGTTNVAPYLAISSKIGDSLRPYAAYQAVIRNHGAADSHVVSAGVEYPLSEIVTFKPEMEVAFITASNRMRSYESYGIGIESYVQLYDNLYLIPFVTTAVNTSTKAKDSSYDFDTATSVAAGLGLYYYWK